MPANRPFKIDLSNAGTTPAEFESLRLAQGEGAGGWRRLVAGVPPLAPGEYDFFDDFHPDARAVLVAK